MKTVEDFESVRLSGRQRRLLYEWRKLEERLNNRSDISFHITRQDTAGLPIAYTIDYHIRSICGVEGLEHLGEPGISNPPLFASEYRMLIDLPPGYPCIDSPPALRFLTADENGNPIPHPWHPNIRYFGSFAGRVCINMADSYTDLAWGVERVGQYLRYERYHAVNEPPYPEDMQVAAWVIRQGEPNEWVYFSQAAKE